MKKLVLPLLISAGAFVSLSPLAQAQPDINQAPKGDNPKNWDWNGPMVRPQHLTPEQIAQFQAQQQEARALGIRQILTQSGFTDTTVQDAIVAFYKDKEIARTKLQTQWQNLTKTLRQPEVTDAQLTTQLNDFEAAADTERARRDKAIQDLSAKIGLSQKPRLQLLLMSLGLIGDQSALVKPDTIGGMGGFFGNMPGIANMQGLANIPGMQNFDLGGLLQGLGNNANIRVQIAGQ